MFSRLGLTCWRVLWHLTPEYGDRHDVWGLAARIEGQTRYSMSDILVGERSTCNVQLSRFNGVTERAHGGRDIGTGTMFGLSDAGGLVRPEGSGRRLGFHLGNNADIQLADVASGLLKRWN